MAIAGALSATLGGSVAETPPPAPVARPTPAAAGVTLGDFAISALACLAIVTAFLASSERFLHWFVFPVTLCGILIGVDAVRWFRGKLDPLAPVGILGLLGFHFFFLAPLLHVHWDYWLLYVVPPDEWRGWLGKGAWLNLVGLVLYMASRSYFARRQARRSPAFAVVLKPSRLFPLLIPMLAITFALQMVIFARTGGLTGLAPSAETAADLQGFGIVFLVSESFPILAILGYAVWAKSRGIAPSWWQVGAVLLLFAATKLLFGGLRGSRSNTVWGIFWGVGIIHLWLRPFPRRVFVAGISVVVAFMYLYGFYKSYGTDAIEIIQSAELREERGSQGGRTIQGTILGDLARSDIQAFLIYRLTDPTIDDEEFTYGWGRTYIGAITQLVPAQIWPGRPPTKLSEGTDAMYGTNSYVDGRRSSRVYGMLGEAMLNVTPIASPLCFIVLGWVTAAVGWRFRRLAEGDARLLMLPFLVTTAVITLTADSDNLVFFLIKNGTIPFILIMLAATRVRSVGRRAAPAVAGIPPGQLVPVGG